ncbi:MAG: hypothetical protein GY820_48510 [Gammaproteobacteria bacterium]|nr:hypothetical protein [Gammaproteobacteria bacterium]
MSGKEAPVGSAEVEEMDERKKEEIHTTTTVTTPQTPDHFSQQQSTSGASSAEESIVLATSPVHFRFEENEFPSKFIKIESLCLKILFNSKTFKFQLRFSN